MLKSQGDIGAITDLRMLSSLVVQPHQNWAQRLKQRFTSNFFLTGRPELAGSSFCNNQQKPRRASIGGDLSRQHSRDVSFSEHWFDWLGNSVENLVAERRNALSFEQRLPPPNGLRERIKRGRFDRRREKC